MHTKEIDVFSHLIFCASLVRLNENPRLNVNFLASCKGFPVAQQKPKHKCRRIFFATDLHSSEIVFRRFIHRFPGPWKDGAA